MPKIKGKQIALNTDPNLGTSDQIIPSQYAIKQYVDTRVSETNAVIYTYIIDQATSSPAIINHNLGTFNYLVSVYDNATGQDVTVDIDRASINSLEIFYGVLANDLTVLIFAGEGIASTSGEPALNPQSNEVGLNIVTSNTFNATINTHYIHYNHTTSGTVLLPATPKFGQQIVVSDMTGNANVNNIIIDGNGNLINGSSTATINTDYGTIMLIYNNINWIGSAFTS